MKRDEYDRSSHGTAKPDPAIGPRARVDDLGADPRLSSGPQRPSRAAHKGRTHDRTRNQVVTSLQFFLAMQEPSTHGRDMRDHDDRVGFWARLYLARRARERPMSAAIPARKKSAKAAPPFKRSAKPGPMPLPIEPKGCARKTMPARNTSRRGSIKRIGIWASS